MHNPLVPVLLLVLLVGVAQATRVKRVVAGAILERGQWPWLVSLHYKHPTAFTEKTRMKHVCGGTLIDPQWVLTAAHCVEAAVIAGGPVPENWEVVLGEHNQYIDEAGEQIMKVESIHQHPKFNFSQAKNLLFDLALIKLSSAVVTSQYANAIPMRTEKSLAAKTRCEIAGWGQVSEEPFGYGMFIPFKATVYVIPNKRCARSYTPDVNEDWLDYKVDRTVICAGTLKPKKAPLLGNMDACNGDSGGPLVCNTGPAGTEEVVGVVSTGKGCGAAHFPGIYTRIALFQPWITKTMATKATSE